MKGEVRIMHCTCEHEFQDEMYGKGMRVHNVGEKSGMAYCTVCAPNYRINRMSPATADVMPSPAMKNAFIPKQKARVGKKVA